jgi:hypothetical protein
VEGKNDHTFEILTDSYALCITSIRCTSSADLSLNVISFGCEEIYLYKGQLSTSRSILSLYRRLILFLILLYVYICEFRQCEEASSGGCGCSHSECH